MVEHWMSPKGFEEVFFFGDREAGEHLPRAARRWAGRALDGLDRDLVYTVGLLLSELVTNAVKHGLPGDVIVKIVEQFSELHCRVSSNTDGSFPRLKPADDHGEGGRGLAIVDSYASSWSWILDGPDRIWVLFDIPLPDEQLTPTSPPP